MAVDCEPMDGLFVLRSSDPIRVLCGRCMEKLVVLDVPGLRPYEMSMASRSLAQADYRLSLVEPPYCLRRSDSKNESGRFVHGQATAAI